ncbi:hypothetical protein [Hyperthermus butylicus]|uniref:Conserved crenarchaeal protein n=1 Tax=Hyperthermus butylicus (strain DSM 5456 / JCM 9403 / PLM1-5) TaxID=415426 RepID=A2BK64_HYPBU|nr:hypothetical protein [Hyperthermus butylicus]ABM80375.1 conserved crenarchaeal protein [Hyperthermus butylicus DSM 5456]
MDARSRLISILKVIVSRDVVSPGDVVVETKLPRYLVLAAFQCLEALGIVEPVFTKGSYKLYTARSHAKKLLEALLAGAEDPILALANDANTVQVSEPSPATVVSGGS